MILNIKINALGSQKNINRAKGQLYSCTQSFCNALIGKNFRVQFDQKSSFFVAQQALRIRVQQVGAELILERIFGH